MDVNVKKEKFLIKAVPVFQNLLVLVIIVIDQYSNRFHLVVQLQKTVIHVVVLLVNLSVHQMIVLSMDLGLDGQNGLNVQQKNVELVINGERECVWVQ